MNKNPSNYPPPRLEVIQKIVTLKSENVFQIIDSGSNKNARNSFDCTNERH